MNAFQEQKGGQWGGSRRERREWDNVKLRRQARALLTRGIEDISVRKGNDKICVIKRPLRCGHIGDGLKRNKSRSKKPDCFHSLGGLC